MAKPDKTAGGLTVAGWAGRIALVLAIIFLANWLIGGAVRGLELAVRPEAATLIERGIWLTCLVYGLILALPFVPGVEIGIAMLSMFGASVAPHVYLSTVAGLTLSFMVGRLVPLRVLARAALAARMKRTSVLLARLEAMDHKDRLDLLLERAPAGWAEWLIRYRYVALAILLNLPGTAIIGGGGGIALVAGLSRLFRPGIYIGVVCIAVSPVPLLVYLFGVETILPITGKP